MLVTGDDLMSGNTGDNEGDSGESTEEETEDQARQQAAAARQRRLTSQGMAILPHQNRIPANAAVNTGAFAYNR